MEVRSSVTGDKNFLHTDHALNRRRTKLISVLLYSGCRFSIVFTSIRAAVVHSDLSCFHLVPPRFTVTMGSFHAQLSSYPADLGAGAHTQPYPTHAGYHSNNQQRHYMSAAQGLGSREFSSLKSQLAALQSQLAERDKDAAEARTVIGYLLKLNAHSATGGTTLLSHKPGQKEPDTSSVILAGEVKESLAVIIDLLRDKLNTTIDDRKDPPGAYRCSKDACGDLLDLSDDCPALQPPVIEKSLALKGPPIHSAALPESRLGISEVQSAIENTDPLSGQVPNLDSDPFPLPPCVTRFDRPRNQGFCIPNLEHADQAVSLFYKTGIRAELTIASGWKLAKFFQCVLKFWPCWICTV